MRGRRGSPGRRGLCQWGVVLGAVLLSACADGVTVVSLELDDTLASQMRARELLADHGMRATFFVNSGWLDTPGHLTTEELLALAGDGHEIGGHTVSHADLPSLPEAEQRREICEDREALIDLGLTVDSFAYPAGRHDSVSQRIARACGYESARRAGGIGGACWFCTPAESIPPENAFVTRTPGSLQVSHDLAHVQRLVRDAQRSGGGWMQLTFHYICDGCDDYSISEEDLATMLDWLARERARGAIEVLTVREVIQGEL